MKEISEITLSSFVVVSRRGFEKIKEAMWKVDPLQGNSFSAYKESLPPAPSLFDSLPDEPLTAKLRGAMVDKFKGKVDIPVSEIFTWTIEDTETFLPTHARRELENLIDRRLITFTDPENRTRRKGNLAS